MQKKNKANLALGVSAAGFLGTMGLASGFWGGMLHHGFLAATIGGLADWFAVTAIFHRPLGISYRTDILRRNRGRIMDALVTFASDDLLSTENIMGVIEGQNSAQLLADYFLHRGGRKRVHEVVKAVMLKSVNDMDTKRIAGELAPAIKEGLQSLAVEDILPEIMRLLAQKRHTDRLLGSLVSIGEQVIESPALKAALLEHIRILRESYEKDSAGRAFVLASMGLTDERILSLLTERIKARLAGLQAGVAESSELQAGLTAMLLNLSQDERLRDLLMDRKEQLLDKLDLAGVLSRWLEHNIQGEEPFWLPQLEAYTNSRIDEFISSRSQQEQFDKAIKKILREELNKHHVLITGIIRERLNEFSDDELVAFVEGKVQDDLQMIRINGSLVGSLVGMGLYLLMAAAERMWGL